MSAFNQKEDKKKEEIVEEYEDLEFQIFRMKENMKEIAKHHQVLGIDQTKEEKWVIVYSVD
ncbi:hypothetical protein AOA60_26370, partial [Pseudomonas sp. 2822-17]